jgi:hypothetical protein
VAEKNAEGKWLIKEPADKKDREASPIKALEPISRRKQLKSSTRTSAAVASKWQSLPSSFD